MHRLALSAVSFLAFGIAPTLTWAHHHEWNSCNLHSDYAVHVAADKLEFSSISTMPARVEMIHGRLLIDGREQTLTAKDHERIAEFEARVRALVPEVREIALEAVDIAFRAVDEVAQTFAGDSERTREKLRRSREEIRSRLDAQFAAGQWNDAVIADAVERAVRQIVPELVGNVTAVALTAAFSGDESAVHELEERAERMANDLEARVEKRAQVLEARADALCPEIAELERIEAGLELRLPDQRPLRLIRSR